MYAIPLILLVVVGVIAVAWTPVFALIFAAIAIVGFFAYIGMKPRADETEPVHPDAPPTPPSHEDLSHGVWGEK